jgi:hypothetical protein
MLNSSCVVPGFLNTMKNLLRYCSLFVALYAFGSVANAQQEKTGYTGKIGTTYDQAKNETQMQLGYVPVSIDKGKMALLNISASFAGKKMLAKPDDVTFIVSVVNAKGHMYPKINDITLTSSGRSVGQMLLLNLDQRDYSDNEVLETLGTRMKMDVFHTIAASKQPVSFKIAESTLVIDPVYLAKLVELETAITP